MERLTVKQLDGTYHIYDNNVIRKASCCDENNKNWFSLYEGKAVDKLGAYEDAEEQGLLFRLPFAVGDIVYWVADAIYPFEVKDIRIDAFGFNVRFAYRGTDENRRYWEIVNSISVVGEKVFLTKEEAEAALEGMSEKENENE